MVPKGRHGWPGAAAGLIIARHATTLISDHAVPLSISIKAAKLGMGKAESGQGNVVMYVPELPHGHAGRWKFEVPGAARIRLR